MERLSGFADKTLSSSRNSSVPSFGERQDVFEHNVDVCLALADVDDERIGNFPPWVSLNARRPAGAARDGRCARAAVLFSAGCLHVADGGFRVRVPELQLEHSNVRGACKMSAG